MPLPGGSLPFLDFQSDPSRTASMHSAMPKLLMFRSLQVVSPVFIMFFMPQFQRVHADFFGDHVQLLLEGGPGDHRPVAPLGAAGRFVVVDPVAVVFHVGQSCRARPAASRHSRPWRCRSWNRPRRPGRHSCSRATMVPSFLTPVVSCGRTGAGRGRYMKTCSRE